MKQPIVIGGYTFKSKKDATESIRKLLYGYPVGSSIHGDDFQFLLSLLERHPESDEKAGCGIKSIEVEQNGPTRGFWLTRVDGSRTDWSFVSCLTPQSHERQALAAFRTAIIGQIQAFKDASFIGSRVLQCPFSGEEITADSCHVDHAPPVFADLVTAFLVKSGIQMSDVLVIPTTDGSTKTELLDSALAGEWQVFHLQHARLRAVSRVANLSILRRSKP